MNRNLNKYVSIQPVRLYFMAVCILPGEGVCVNSYYAAVIIARAASNVLLVMS